MLMNPENPEFCLGVDQMDDMHQRFMELLNQLENAEKGVFARLFQELVVHTEAHFMMEQELMQSSRFPATREHLDEHNRVLGELGRFAIRVSKGSMLLGRAYAVEQLPDWFELHSRTMDSALAAHLKQSASCNE
ncbi:MAG: hemerythrin domain-containing protein [Candidatus Thiodiazotropha sp.]|jgi:hemerythrin